MTTDTSHWFNRQEFDTQSDDVWMTTVRLLIAEALTQASPDLRVQTLARAMGQSPRSFQRALERRGTNLSKVLDVARCAVAVDLLADRDVTIVQIAVRVGYATGPAFFRAFRRWTGTTPRAYQRSLLAGASIARVTLEESMVCSVAGIEHEDTAVGE